MPNAALGGKYDDYANFTMRELMQHIGVYFLHALSPSPMIEMKFSSQEEDPDNDGNDFIHCAFGGLAWKVTRRHKYFKCFLTSVNPLIPVPNRDVYPNWKVHPLLKWRMIKPKCHKRLCTWVVMISLVTNRLLDSKACTKISKKSQKSRTKERGWFFSRLHLQ